MRDPLSAMRIVPIENPRTINQMVFFPENNNMKFYSRTYNSRLSDVGYT